MTNNITEYILLTGAGFTRNFGGFLAKDMWSLIFNHPLIQKRPIVKEKMLYDYDYELIYHYVLSSNSYDEEDKIAMRTATKEAYTRLDDIVLKWIFRSDAPHPVNIYKVNEMIELFAGKSSHNMESYFFTLNQDLFVERHFNTHGNPLVLPGVVTKPNPADSIAKQQPLKPEDFIALPTEDRLSEISSRDISRKHFHYMKLHGSYNWKRSQGLDMMVIGQDKEEQIIREPLLKWYFDIFKKVLSQKSTKLFIIGYGFNDKHINEIITKSVKENDLRFYVLSPEVPKNFTEKLLTLESGEVMLKGLAGYFPYNLLEVFPADQSETVFYNMIVESIFRN